GPARDSLCAGLGPADAAYLPAMLCLAACSAATSRSGATPSWWAIAANAGLAGSTPSLPSPMSWLSAPWAARWLTPSWAASALTSACWSAWLGCWPRCLPGCRPASVPNTAAMTRCAVACDTPVDEAKAVIPAAVLPPACFAAMSPAWSWLTLIPADAASAGSGEGNGDLVAPADACGGVGLPDGEPDASAATGTAIAVAVTTPAMARRWCRANMGRSCSRKGHPKSTDGGQD